MKTKLMTVLLVILLSVFTASCATSTTIEPVTPPVPEYLVTLPAKPAPPADIDGLMDSDILAHTAALDADDEVCRARHAALVTYCTADNE